ncbi:MAG: CbbX protein, partial [Synechococcus sp.]|nr:CbbX protein [Synechococcus sp.]
LMAIAGLLLEAQHYQFSADAQTAFAEYVSRRRQLPFFANARSVRNALDRARLRQANRLFSRMGEALTKLDLITIEAADIRASRVFKGEVEGHHPGHPAS